MLFTTKKRKSIKHY